MEIFAVLPLKGREHRTLSHFTEILVIFYLLLNTLLILTHLQAHSLTLTKFDSSYTSKEILTFCDIFVWVGEVLCFSKEFSTTFLII